MSRRCGRAEATDNEVGINAPAACWDDLAGETVNHAIDDVPPYERKLVKIHAWMRSHHQVLDVSCGAGSFTVELAPLVAHVHGRRSDATN